MRPSLRRAVATLAAAALAASLIGGCSAGSDDTDSSPRPAGSGSAPASSGPSSSSAGSGSAGQRVYVAVGASETVGVGADDPATQAWPVVLRERALPAGRLVNVGAAGATVTGALRTQLPAALEAAPDVVTVWLAVNDLLTGAPVTAYQRRLGRLVRALRRDGRTAVLVGNLPELWRLPAYRACLPGAPSAGSELACVLPFVPSVAEVRAEVARFNRAIRTVVRREGARLVDLSGVPFGARLTAADGFHPSTAGHRRLAAAFAARLP